MSSGLEHWCQACLKTSIAWVCQLGIRLETPFGNWAEMNTDTLGRRASALAIFVFSFIVVAPFVCAFAVKNTKPMPKWRRLSKYLIDRGVFDIVAFVSRIQD